MMKTRNQYVWLKTVLPMLLLMALLTACKQNRDASAGQPNKNTGNHTMYANAQTIETAAALPAIDTLAPAEYKTATFGLG
jgi:hypothetical protein